MRWAECIALAGAIAGCSIDTEGLKELSPDAHPAAIDAGQVIPPAPELCDGLDNDGDPATADGVEDRSTGVACDGSDVDMCPEGLTVCVGGRIVCDDPTGNTHETCNETDDDCDGVIDEEAMDAATYYPDADGDGWGVDAPVVVACAAPPDHALGTADCDDGNAAVSPGATETCNLVDDNCNETIDDAEPSCGCVGHADDSRVYLFCQTDSTWGDAQASCAGRGGHLASVLSMDEHAFLLERVTFYEADTPWWIGFTDDGSEMDWRWIDGSTAGFTAWGDGEPNDGGDEWFRDEDCATMNTFSTRTWNDTACDDFLPYVCKLPPVP